MVRVSVCVRVILRFLVLTLNLVLVRGRVRVWLRGATTFPVYFGNV